MVNMHVSGDQEFAGDEHVNWDMACRARAIARQFVLGTFRKCCERCDVCIPAIESSKAAMIPPPSLVRSGVVQRQ